MDNNSQNNQSAQRLTSKAKKKNIIRGAIIAACATVLAIGAFLLCSYYLIFPETGYALKSSFKKNIGIDFDFKWKRFSQRGTLDSSIDISSDELALLNERLADIGDIKTDTSLMICGNEFKFDSDYMIGDSKDKLNLTKTDDKFVISSKQYLGDTTYGISSKNLSETIKNSVFSPTGVSKFAFNNDTLESIYNIFDENVQNPFENDFDTVIKCIKDTAKESKLSKSKNSYGKIKLSGDECYAKTKTIEINKNKTVDFIDLFINIICEEEKKINITEVTTETESDIYETDTNTTSDTLTDADTESETEREALDWLCPTSITTIVIDNPDLIRALNNILSVAGLEYENDDGQTVAINDHLHLIEFLEQLENKLKADNNSINIDVNISYIGKYVASMSVNGNAVVDGKTHKLDFYLDFGSKPAKNRGLSTFFRYEMEHNDEMIFSREISALYTLPESSSDIFKNNLSLKIKLADKDKAAEYDYLINCTRDRSTDNLSIVVSSDSGENVVTLRALFTDSASLLKFKLDSLTVERDGKLEEYSPTLSFTLNTKCDEISTPDYNDILKLSESELSKIYTKIYPCLSKIKLDRRQITLDGFPLSCTSNQYESITDDYVTAFDAYLKDNISDPALSKNVYVYDSDYGFYMVMTYSEETDKIYCSPYNYIKDKTIITDYDAAMIDENGKLCIIKEK